MSSRSRAAHESVCHRGADHGGRGGSPRMSTDTSGWSSRGCPSDIHGAGPGGDAERPQEPEGQCRFAAGTQHLGALIASCHDVGERCTDVPGIPKRMRHAHAWVDNRVCAGGTFRAGSWDTCTATSPATRTCSFASVAVTRSCWRPRRCIKGSRPRLWHKRTPERSCSRSVGRGEVIPIRNLRPHGRDGTSGMVGGSLLVRQVRGARITLNAAKGRT
jgi:hypothetical protein